MRLHAVFVFVFVFVLGLKGDGSITVTTPHPPDAGEGAVEYEHPSTSQPEVATVTHQPDDHPTTKPDESETDDPSHPLIEPIGDGSVEQNHYGSEHEYDGCMTDGIEKRQPKAAPTGLRGTAEI
jgi:hypothetical protein